MADRQGRDGQPRTDDRPLYPESDIEHVIADVR
jgi:hypothetical protein